MKIARRRVRVRPLEQLGPSDCGPACLRMVLDYFGRHVSARELSSEPVSARNGVTAAWLIDAAGRQGLHAEGFAVPVDQLALLPTPAILHTTSAHFVVFEGLTRGRIVIVDPSVGERWYLYEEEARNQFSGTAIAFEPAAEFEPRSRARLLLRALRPVLTLDWRTSALVAFAAIALSTLSLVLGTDWFWPSVLDDVRRFLPALPVLDRMVVIAGGLVLCVMPLMGLVDASIGGQLHARLARLEREPTTEERERRTARHAAGDVLHYFAPIDPLTTATLPAPSTVILTAAALLGAAYASWSAGGSVAILLAAFSASLIASVIAAHLTSRSVPRSAPRSRALTVYVVSCAYVLVWLTIWLIAFRLGGTIRDSQSGAPFPRGMHALVPPVLLALATFRIGGVVTQGRQWLGMYERLWEGLPEARSRADVNVSSVTELDGSSPTPLPHAPLLALRGVTLRHGDKRDRLLSRLELDLNEGEHVAIIGSTAAGKTTLIRAIIGDASASAGTILYCGRPLSEYPQSDRERLVHGMVQGDRLPDSTISRILRTGNRDISLSQMQAVCAQLGFDEEFSGLPLGYDTPVVFDGDTLSRGQRQLLMLARVVASGARLLALDDPVNSLDDERARRVLAGLATLPSAVVITMASASALCDLDFRVVHLDEVTRESETRTEGARWLTSEPRLSVNREPVDT